MTIANTLQAASNLAVLISLGEFSLAAEIAPEVQSRIRQSRPCCRNCQQGKEVKSYGKESDEKAHDETKTKTTTAAPP